MGGMLHLPQPSSVPPVHHAASPAAAARHAPRAAPKPPPKRSPPPQYGAYANTSAVTWPRSSVGQRRPTSAPGLGWMGLVTAHGELAETAGPPTSTQRTCWTTSSGTMRLIRPNGTRHFRVGPGEVQSAHAAHGCPPCGGARGVPVGSPIWSDWVCSTTQGSDFHGEYGGKYILQTGRGEACRICRVSADDGRLERRPTGTGATSAAARAGCGWSP